MKSQVKSSKSPKFILKRKRKGVGLSAWLICASAGLLGFNAAAADIQLSGIGSVVSGEVRAQATVDEAVKQVQFKIPGVLNRIERIAPYALKGDRKGKLHPWDTTELANGNYFLTVIATLEDGTEVTERFPFKVENASAVQQTAEVTVGMHKLPSQVYTGQRFSVPTTGLDDGEVVWLHVFDRKWGNLIRKNLVVKDDAVELVVPDATGVRRVQLQYKNEFKQTRMVEVLPPVQLPTPQPEPGPQPEPEVTPQPEPTPDATPAPEAAPAAIQIGRLPSSLVVGQKLTVPVSNIDDGERVFFHVFDRQWGDLARSSVVVQDGKLTFTIPNKTGERLIQLQYKNEYKTNQNVVIAAAGSPEVVAPEPTPQPETQPEPEPQPEPEAQPEPTPQPQPETQPEPEAPTAAVKIDLSSVPTSVQVGQSIRVPVQGIADGKGVFCHVFDRQWGNLKRETVTVRNGEVILTIPNVAGERILQLQYESSYKTKKNIVVSGGTVTPDAGEPVPVPDAPVTNPTPEPEQQPEPETTPVPEPEVVTPEPEPVDSPEATPTNPLDDQAEVLPPLPGTVPEVRPGSGWRGDTATPDQVGDRHERAIAHWNIVPEQSIKDGFTVGVIAHHIYGMDRVVISANGGPWVTIEEPSVNPRTKCEEYWARLTLPAGYNKPIELRAIAYPKRGKPYVVRPMGDVYSKQDLTLYPYAVGEVIELGRGRHTLERRNLPDTGWLTVRAKPGLDRDDVVIDKIGTDWHSGRLKFEGVTLKLGSGGSALRGRWSSRNGGQHVWIDDCKIVGNGPANQTWWTAYMWETAFYTDTEVTQVQTAFHGDVGMVRNCWVHHNYEDTFRMMGLHVNVTIENIDRQPLMDAQPGFDAPHPDLWQRQTVRNTIIQDITATNNVNGQGFFPNHVENTAIVRAKIDTVSPFRSMQIMGSVKNLLIQDTRFYGSSNVRGKVLEGERLIMRDVSAGSRAPFLPHGWEADGIYVYPKPPLYD
jgi:outer membrane biosynthesis protein TonB